MALKFTINNIASYKSPVSINIDKRINFFYGLNGSGKTTIANFLQNPNQDCFCDCKFSEGQDKEFIVYNENFVGKQFYESTEQKGIFTLGIENKEAESNIENAREQIKNLEEQLQQSNLQLEETKANKIKLENGLKNEIWKLGSSYKNSPLDFCLTGYKNNKDNFCSKILEAESETDEKITFQSLGKEINSLEGEEAEIKSEIPKICINISTIENDQIFQEIIVGNHENPLSNLIEELNNSNWVKKGLTFLETQTKCPFCQKELEKQIIANIRDYFDEIYLTKINSLNNLKSQYKEEIEKIPRIEVLKEEQYVLECPDFINQLIEFQTILNNNLSLIEKKINEPNGKVELSDTETQLNLINDYIAQINKNIQEHNEKITNKEKVKEGIKNSFFKCLRRENELIINQYLEEDSKYKDLIEELESKIETNIPSEIKKENEIISENLNKITNIESSINNINNYLEYLAIDSFQIKKSKGNFYKIARENHSDDQFKSLSEGEKTIISFLYFLELCQGSLSSDCSVDKDKKIIIIDDPVSSLSYTYVFNIADLIKSRIIDMDYASVCIFTHNLYFFHELCTRNNKALNKGDVGLYRLSKNVKTTIQDLKRDDIQNDYSAYWRIIKDFDEDENLVSNSILAISMRNIIEHFFTFIDNKKDLNEVMIDIKNMDSNYSAFHRYMNRSAHSDSINQSEINDIDSHIFRRAFEEVFDKTGYSEHYYKMLQ